MSQFHIFHWHSEALKTYTTGDIVAIGQTVDDARKVARTHFEKLSTKHYEDMAPYIATGQWAPDDDDKDRRDEMLRLLELDIMKEPEVSDAFFINGGE